MGQSAKPIRENRTITVDFHDASTYFQLIDDGKAFMEFVLAFILSIGFQLNHKVTCSGGGCLTRHSHYRNHRKTPSFSYGDIRWCLRSRQSISSEVRGVTMKPLALAMGRSHRSGT